MKTVWVYVDTRIDEIETDHVKIFANEEAARAWFDQNDPEAHGLAYEYPVIGSKDG